MRGTTESIYFFVFILHFLPAFTKITLYLLASLTLAISFSSDFFKILPTTLLLFIFLCAPFFTLCNVRLQSKLSATEAEGFDFISLKSKQPLSLLSLSARSDITRSSPSPETNRKKEGSPRHTSAVCPLTHLEPFFPSNVRNEETERRRQERNITEQE